MSEVVYLLSNPTKLLFLTLDEAGSRGVVLDCGDRTGVRHASPGDLVTNQYVECKIVKREGGVT